jgi:hypothetical protein
MISDSSIEFYNNRLVIDYTKMKDLSPQMKDRIRHYGGQAEALLKNKDLAMFVHHYKFELTDNLASIRGYGSEDNAQRVAIAHELSGIDSFVNSLKRAVYLKNKLGNTDIDAQV